MGGPGGRRDPETRPRYWARAPTEAAETGAVAVRFPQNREPEPPHPLPFPVSAVYVVVWRRGLWLACLFAGPHWDVDATRCAVLPRAARLLLLASRARTTDHPPFPAPWGPLPPGVLDLFALFTPTVRGQRLIINTTAQ